MKILFISDYSSSYYEGGAEISAYWQAKKLRKKGIKIYNLTSSYKKTKSPIFFLNPFFILFQFIKIIRVVKKKKINLIHCQGKYSVPPAAIAKIFLKIPLIITLRDYKGICNHGFCLWKRKKGCNIISFYKKDFLFYYNYYIEKKNIFSFFLQLAFSYIGKINTFVLSFFMKKADRFICVSNFIKKTYFINGFDKKKMDVIYNPIPQIVIKDIKIPKRTKRKLRKYKNKILYAGKLSLGKGANLLIAAAREVIKKRKDILFIFCGKMFYPIEKVDSEQILFLGQLDYLQLIKLMSLVDIVCVPSSWPEPLSRVAIEAFYLKKPVLASSVGGLKELVSSKNGWLVRPKPKALKEKIEFALKNKNSWQVKGKHGEKLITKMEKKQINKLISLYKTTISY